VRERERERDACVWERACVNRESVCAERSEILADVFVGESVFVLV